MPKTNVVFLVKLKIKSTRSEYKYLIDWKIFKCWTGEIWNKYAFYLKTFKKAQLLIDLGIPPFARTSNDQSVTLSNLEHYKQS